MADAVQLTNLLPFHLIDYSVQDFELDEEVWKKYEAPVDAEIIAATAKLRIVCPDHCPAF